MSEPLLAPTSAALLRHVAAVQTASRQPSLIAGVVRDGQLAWWAARGTETGLADGCDPHPDLQYRIGSIAKPLCAITVLQCRDEGLLDLDDQVDAHLPHAPFGDSTLRRLLSHSAALPAEPAGPWWERNDAAHLDDLFDRVQAQRPVLDGRAEHHYSNLGYALLGAVVAHRRAAPWDVVVAERVLEPLTMSRTSYLPYDPHAHGRSVHPYTGRLQPEPHTDTGSMASAGQLWSTLGDLARFAAFLLDPVPVVLSNASMREMTTVASAPAGDAGGAYGMGLRVEAASTGTRVGHSGSMPGFLAGVVAEPGAGLAAVAMSNGTIGATPGLAAVLLDEVLARETAVAPVWQPEPVVDGADDVVGPWYWGNTPYAIAVRGGRLCLEHADAARSSRFERLDNDHWQGLDNYFAGELLTVQRNERGAVTGLSLATYEFRCAPAADLRSVAP